MVSLRVGTRDFLGEGPTAQAARHDAASKALHHLKSLPLPEDSLQHCDAGIQENGKNSLKTTSLPEVCAGYSIHKVFTVIVCINCHHHGLYINIHIYNRNCNISCAVLTGSWV
jgi:hypothetical protein